MIYLASPYSDPSPVIRAKRFLSACRVAALLSNGDQLVFSPIAHSHPILMAGNDQNYGYYYWRAFDEHIISRACTMVYVLALDGYRESKGITAEVACARKVGLPVFLLDPVDLSLSPYPWPDGSATELR